MLARPTRTLEAVALERVEPRRLMLGYVAPLAAIPAVCGVVGVLLFGINIANVGVQMNLGGLILASITGYVLTFVVVYLLALFIDMVAPAFGGVRERRQALKLSAHAGTASWVGGLAAIYPSLAIPVGILAALYSLYALLLGLPILMQVPEHRALSAFFTVLLALVILMGGRGVISAKAAELGGPLSATYAPR